MQFRLLGRIEARHDGSVVELGRRRERCLLGILLLEVGTAVPVDRLVDLLWDGAPPTAARASLHAHISRLRGQLDPDGQGTYGIRLISRQGGYLADTTPESVDAHRFRSLFASARALVDPADRSAGLREALALWRGPLLADVASDRLRERIGTDLTEGRLQATEMAIEADLDAGRTEQAIVELTGLTSQYPTRERLRAQLMLALYQSGRQADALKVFHDTRRLLLDELGIEPGPELQETQRQILAGESSLVTPAPAAPRARLRRNDLPGDVADFTGRQEETRRLLDVLSNAGAPAAVTISALDGMAGIGKTALAVHVAHRMAEHYPDAQLFINLHGHTADQDPMAPQAALDTLLRALGVEPERIPDDLDERAALWRAELATRRAVVVLDNAASAGQVRPLLPGTPGCLALITSRRRLADLEAVHALSVDVLPPPDAEVLFARVAGGERVATEPDMVTEVVRLCGYLPLAIRISGARLRTRPAWTVGHLAERLAEGRRRLAEFTTGDRSVAAAFTLSYEHLGAEQRRLFRLLGLQPGVEFDTYVAAAVAELSLDQASLLLEELVDAHLLQQPAPDRYRFHDLLREHAAAVAAQTETDPDRREAVGRVLDHYLRTAVAAMQHVDPRGIQIQVEPARPPIEAPAIDGKATALDWLDTEYANLVAIIGYAAEHGWHTHAWQLPHVLQFFFNLRSRTPDWIATHRVGLRAARELGDPHAEAETLKNLGLAYWMSRDCQEAVGFHEQALRLYREIGDRLGEGDTLNNLGLALERLGRFDEALHSYQESLAVRLAIGHRRGQGTSLLNLGNVCDRLGRFDESVDHYLKALAILQEIGEERAVGILLGNLGVVQERLGRLDEAVSYYRQALVLAERAGDAWARGSNMTNLGNACRRLGHFRESLELHREALRLARETGDRGMECEILNNLGDVRCAIGEPDDAIRLHERAMVLAVEGHNPLEQAHAHRGIGNAWLERDPGATRRHWTQAVAIYTELGVPEAAQVSERLAGLDAAS